MSAEASISGPVTWPRSVTIALGLYAALGGAISFLGWPLDIPRLTDWGGTGVSIQPNAALLITLAGLGVLLLQWRHGRWTAVLGAIVALVGGATFLQYLVGADFGFNHQLLFGHTWGQLTTLTPGRVGPPASSSFLILGSALVTLGATSATASSMRRWLPIAGLAVCASMLFSLSGFLFGARSFYALPALTAIALQTSTLLMALAMSVVLAVPERQPMLLLTSDSGSGAFARRVIPVLIALPLVLGWLRARGEAIGLYDTGTGRSLLIVSLIILGLATTWWALAELARQEASERASRERATEILGSITDAFFVVDRDWRFTFVNEHAIRRIGRQDLIGRTLWEAVPARRDGDAYGQLQGAMRDRISVVYDVFVEPWQKWLRDCVYPTADGGLAIYSREVTQQKIAEEALRESDRRKDEFLATLAHELRNPLAPMRNALELMKASSDAATSARARNMMERQLISLVRLVDDLLDLHRISRGKIELRVQPVSLTEVIARAVETTSAVTEARGHHLSVEVPDETIFLRADPIRLAQVFSNLLDNAAKFTAERGELAIAAVRQFDEAVITVRDSGIGIPSDMLTTVFERFAQVEPRANGDHGGLGIGLSLVKELVELHGGRVEARSGGSHGGSEFVVRLPVTQPPATALEIQEPRLATVPAPSRRVLVVDDNRDAAESLALLLKVMGNETAIAHLGAEALEKAEAFGPDLVILDIGLPDLDGYEVCRRLRSRPWSTGTVIAACTGWGQEADKLRSRGAGFT
jgi:signal transduction histidine kinase/CheY-like chemotaxis protein